MRWPCLLLAAVVACGEDAPPPFVLPALSTSHALFATAVAGRPLLPRAVQVIGADQQAGLRPDMISGGDIDAVWAGLDPRDLPTGVTPDGLTFLRPDDAGARPLPPLYTPYVLLAPSPPERPERLVAVMADGEPAAVREDRARRLELMLSGVALRDPCVPPPTPWRINTPRIPAEAAVSARAMSDGATVLGLTTTSTALIGVIPPDSLDVELIGVGFGGGVLAQSRATVRALDGPETQHPSGWRVPTRLSLSVQDGFGRVATVWLWRQGRWREDPLPSMSPARSLRGIRSVTVDGVPSLCAFGTALDTEVTAAIWCRPQDGGDWSLQVTFATRLAVTELQGLPGGEPIAADLGGTVYRRGGSGWAPVFEAAVNRGCRPPCAALGQTVTVPREGGLDLWLAGEDAQLLRFRFRGETVEGTAPEELPAVLFGDERADGDDPVSFQAATKSPDGALWLASDRGVLLRRDPDGSFMRLCLPATFDQAEIGAVVAHEDGRLIVASSPVFLAETSWSIR